MRRFSTLAFIVVIVTLQLTLIASTRPVKQWFNFKSPASKGRAATQRPPTPYPRQPRPLCSLASHGCPPIYDKKLTMSLVGAGYWAGRVGLPGVSLSLPQEIETSSIKNVITDVDAAIANGAKGTGVDLVLQTIKTDATAILKSRPLSMRSKIKVFLSRPRPQSPDPERSQMDQGRDSPTAKLLFQRQRVRDWFFHQVSLGISKISSIGDTDHTHYRAQHVAYLMEFMLHAGRATIVLQMPWKDPRDIWMYLEREVNGMNDIINKMESVAFHDKNVPKELRKVVTIFDSRVINKPTQEEQRSSTTSSKSRSSPSSSRPSSSSTSVIEKYIEGLLAPDSPLPGNPFEDIGRAY